MYVVDDDGQQTNMFSSEPFDCSIRFFFSTTDHLSFPDASNVLVYSRSREEWILFKIGGEVVGCGPLERVGLKFANFSSYNIKLGLFFRRQNFKIAAITNGGHPTSRSIYDKTIYNVVIIVMSYYHYYINTTTML